MIRRLFRILAILAVALVAFVAWVHPAMLDITRAGWALHDDWGTNVVGLNAYLRSGAWPGVHQPLMVAPEGASLLLTDSVPLIGLLLKPFAWMLPAGGVQLIGWWLLACLILHAGFAHLLVRRYAPDFLTAWLGTALLTAVPALFNRYPHPSLCAHWTILWALWVFLDPRRSRQVGWWLAVIGVAGLIHSYLLLMVLAIWASALLERLVRRDWWTVAVQAGTIALLVAGIALLLGVTGQGYASTHSYGGFAMALDALANPATTHVSALLPATPDDLGRGFEGLQYLGVGLTLLILAALGTRAMREERGPSLKRLVWLVPAFVVLTMLAISSHWVFQGRTILTIPLPGAVIDALDPIRASGRLFWPVLYTGLFVAIASVERLRLPVARLVLAGALALQIIDIAPMLVWTRHETSAAGETVTYRRATDNRWAALIASASAVEFQPMTDAPDTALLSEVGWRAMLACRPMRFSAVARLSQAQRDRFERDRAAFLAGRIDPTRLYVLFAGEPVPAVLAGRERVIDGVVIIPPIAPAPPPDLCE